MVGASSLIRMPINWPPSRICIEVARHFAIDNAITLITKRSQMSLPFEASVNDKFMALYFALNRTALFYRDISSESKYLGYHRNKHIAR